MLNVVACSGRRNGEAVESLTMNLVISSWRSAPKERKGNVRNALCRLVKGDHEAPVTPTEPFCGLPHPEFRYSRRWPSCWLSGVPFR